MDLYLSIDYNMQAYAQQVADKMLAQKEAKGVSIILMNPQNGEIYAMVNAPEFDLNEPYVLTSAVEENQALADLSENDKLNQMWRNTCINDTYEPGSTFKIITAASALEDGVVSLNDTFSCPGYCIVEDRRIRCHKTTGHGSETFLQGFMNSCNPVLLMWAPEWELTVCTVILRIWDCLKRPAWICRENPVLLCMMLLLWER